MIRGGLSVNMAWAVLGNLFYAGGRFLIIVMLVKYFSSRMVGRLDLALAVVTPLSFLINMELRSVFVTETKGIVAAGHCLSTRLISNCIFIVILISICLMVRDIRVGQRFLLILLAGTVRAAESWTDVYLGVLQKHEQMKRWSISQAIKTIAVLTWVMAASRLTDNITWIPVGWLVVTLLVVWCYDRPQAAKFEDIRIKWDWQRSLWLLGRGFPLGVFVALAILNHQVAKYFIASEGSLGDSSVAYFSAMMNFVFGAVAVQNGVNQAILPRLAEYFARRETKKDFVRLLSRVLGLSWLAMLVMLAVARWQGESILRFFYSSEYARFSDLFFMVILAGCILMTGMILGDAIVACHRFKSRMVAVAIGLLVNVIICWWYIGDYGLKAAVWAAVVSSVVTTTIYALILIHAVRSENGYTNPE